jgi:hypothetical protein
MAGYAQGRSQGHPFPRPFLTKTLFAELVAFAKQPTRFHVAANCYWRLLRIVSASVRNPSRPNHNPVMRANFSSRSSILIRSRSDGSRAFDDLSDLDLFDALPFRFIPHS